MIKIIKPGNAGKEECQVCGCIFTFEYEDVELGDQRNPQNFVKCPCCGDLVLVHILPRRKEGVR